MRDRIIPTRTRARITSDNRAELESWIEERAAALATSGLTPEEAHQRARTEFGDIEGASRYAQQQDVAAERRVRALLWTSELISDARIAFRTLARTPTVTTVVLLTFALGIGAATAVFSVVHALLLRALPYGDTERLVHLPSVDKGVIVPPARHSASAFVAFRERTRAFSGIAGMDGGNWILSDNGDPEQVAGAGFTPNTFDVLRARPSLGRAFTAEEESGPASQVVILLHDLWRRRFGGDSTIIGRTIELSGVRHRVIGVMAPAFRVPTNESAEFIVPREIRGILRNPNTQHVGFLRVFGRLKAGSSVQAAQRDVDQTMRTLQEEFPQFYAGIGARVVPIRTAVAGDARLRLLVLMGAAAFVLLIVCANVSGILLSRALARRHELAVRVALGAGRRRLVRQFLTEGAVLAVLGLALGLAVAQGAIIALRVPASTALPVGTSFALEPTVLLFGTAAAVVTALLSSLVPAFGATRLPGIALRRDTSKMSPSRASRQLRLALVAGQLAISVVLLVGAGLFLRTLQRLSAVDLGYRTEQALTFRVQFAGKYREDAQQDAFWSALYAQLREIPGVVAVGGGNVPLGQHSVTPFVIENREQDGPRPPEARYSAASDDYFTALGIPLLRGRTFNASDHAGAPVVAIVSAGLAKQFWPAGDPIGTRIRLGPNERVQWATIVGIVGDVHLGSAEAPRPTIYTSQRQDHWPGGGAVIVRAQGDPRSLLAGVRQALKRVDPTLPSIGLRSLDEFRRSTPAIAERRMLLQLVLVFALVALAVSAIGVYGVSSYSTQARWREFGIRLALGAPRRRVLLLALQDGAQVAVLGALVGLPFALMLSARIRDLLYAVTPFDALTLVSVLATMLVVVFVASLVPARRAARIDPVGMMRTE
ncbi:MAG TPA: ABC transporter permease [Gemmatimonadaceae bacterium]|nr:ABC transporter permease [Gemmatimonadaceae bacterium]